MTGLDVIALPGHSGMFARRVAVEAWQRSGSPHVNSAGRLYALQKYYWDGWRLRKPGFQPADNPDDESQRLAHVRFVAFDIDPTADRIKRLSAAGFVRPYSYEPWHWELPNVRSYSIVRSIPATAGDDITPIPNDEEEEDDDMRVDIIGHKNEEVAVIAPWLLNGYKTAKVGSVEAIGWARLYSPTKNGLVPMYTRDEYLGMIAGAKSLAEGYQAALPKPGSAGGSVDLKPVLDAVAKIPTAEQNGQAARTAIVKA